MEFRESFRAGRFVTERGAVAGLAAMISLSAIAFAGLAACRRTPALTDQQLEGKHLYQVRCAHCHEENDLVLKKVPPDLHSVFRQSKLPSGTPATDPEVRRVVLMGKGTMPSFAGRFSDQQMNDLLAYLHSGLQ